MTVVLVTKRTCHPMVVDESVGRSDGYYFVISRINVKVYWESPNSKKKYI
jgi:hypothetical protein